jgi:glycosyltransferase involved in cell wall biosynthesis
MNMSTTSLPVSDADKLHQSASQNVLFVHLGDDWIRGSERCLLDLLTHLDTRQFKPVLWCNSPLLAQAAAELEIPTICQNFTIIGGEQLPRWDWQGFYRQVNQGIELVNRYNIDVIHANGGAPCQWLNRVARACDKPLITHLHSRYPLWQRWLFGLHQVDRVIGVSSPVTQQLEGDGMAKQRLSVVANGIDIDKLRAEPVQSLRGMLGLSDGTFVMVGVGSLIARKGFDRSILSCHDLIREGYDVHLVIIGEGPYRSTLEQQIDDLDIAKHVTLMGEQSNVVGWLRGGCDLLLSTAREEAFGLVLLEAACACVAVAAARVGGVDEVIVHGQTGLLHSPDNPQELMHQLKLLIDNRPLRLQLAAAGRARLNAHFSIEANIGRLSMHYRQLAGTYKSNVSKRRALRGTSRLHLFGAVLRSESWRKLLSKKTIPTGVGAAHHGH